MEKHTLLEIILATVGGVLFALGMCMCLVVQWNAFAGGVVLAVIGLLVLLSIIAVHKKAHPAQTHHALDKGLLLTWGIGLLGALVMGFGMSKVMVEPVAQSDLFIGLAAGVLGLLVCVLNYPIYAYRKKRG